MIQKNKAEHLYIHVPFCKSICSYCDFAHIVYDEKMVEKWQHAIEKELAFASIPYDLKTIYIGGGTPTSLSPQQLDTLLTTLDPYTDKVEEYTIEINPETLDEEKTSILKKHKINRASIGLQTMDSQLLKILGRHHTWKQVQDTTKLLMKYDITNYSLDIMYSLPFQTIDLLKQTVEAALTLNPKHLSLYSLTIEENTVFGKKGYMPLDEDTEADMYEWIVQRLKEDGFHQYEVSNFACGDYESIHNKAYWNYKDFYGIGCGASGKINHIRYDKPKLLKRYLENPFFMEETKLSEKDEMFEMIMMGIRLVKGMKISLFEQRFGISFLDVYGEKAKALFEKRLVEIQGDYFRCTEKGYEIMNSILVDLMED